MKISIVGQFGVESFGLHIKENLILMGHEVVSCVSFVPENRKYHSTSRTIIDKVYRAFDAKLRISSFNIRKTVMKRIIKEVCSKKCDLIICTKDYFLDYEIELIKETTGAKVIMWYPDHIMSFGNATFISAGYDALFFKDKYIVRNLRNLYKLNAFYLPECFSTIRHQVATYSKDDEEQYACDLSIIGNMHSFRVPILKQLCDYDLKIYGMSGPWWLDSTVLNNFYTGCYLAYQDKAKAIKYSKINLNTLYFGEVEGVNVRTFEISGMNGFQLLQNKPGLEELFEIDREVVTYETIEELKSKIDYYLIHEAERKKIAQAGYKRAISDHTYVRRLTRLINIVIQSRIDDDVAYDYMALSK